MSTQPQVEVTLTEHWVRADQVRVGDTILASEYLGEVAQIQTLDLNSGTGTPPSPWPCLSIQIDGAYGIARLRHEPIYVIRGARSVRADGDGWPVENPPCVCCAAWDAIHAAYMQGRLAGPPDPDQPAVADDIEDLQRLRAALDGNDVPPGLPDA